MWLIDRLRGLFVKPDVVESDIWASTEPVAVAQLTANPWKPQSTPAPTAPKAENLWRTPTRIDKNWVLHKAAFAVILVNILIALFFYSNNTIFNTMLLTYLGASTILLGHYYSLTRG